MEPDGDGPAGAGMPDDVSERDRPYRRKLLRLLAAATFFEGYDAFVLALVLPLVLVDLGGTESQAGLVRGSVGVGAVVALVLAAQADRIGRRRLLLITIVGYTATTGLTALSPGLLFLAGSQFLAQIFLAAEWAVAVTIVVEEFPTRERGRALGIVTSMNTLGGITVGILGFVGLAATPLSWRGFYVVGLVPLVLVFWARRGMVETARYTAVRESEAGRRLDHMSLLEPWKDAYRRNIMAVGLMHFFRFTAISAAVFWWPYYAQQEAGMSFSLVSLYLGVAGILGAVGFVVGGFLMDRVGRRPTFSAYTALAIVFGVAVFQTHDTLVMLPLLCLAIFTGLGSAAMTSAFSTEFFPTYVRSRAAAWCRNAFEVPGGIVGPLVVGWLGDHRTGPIGSIGDAMSLTLLATMVPVLFITWRYIGETRHLVLDQLDAEVVG
ncbi:MAG: MFS transporter [Actinobacteria bacterium]|nr:MFS transporter [Actinomycetota bacterium]